MSTIKVDNIQTTAGAARYTPQVATTFNGTGAVAINQSGGASSVSDLAVGKYRVNFSTNMQNAVYYANASCSYHNSVHWTYLASNYTGGGQDYTRATSYCHVGSYDGGYVDTPSLGLLVQGT